MARKFLISRIALAVALSSGLTLAAAPAALAAKPKQEKGADYSDGFRKAAAAIQTALADATKGSLTADQFPAAKAKIDAALGGNAAGAFQTAEAAATTPDDKLALGSMMRNYGVISQDKSFMQKGMLLSLSSGKLPPAEASKTNFDLGVTAYQAKDYPGAVKYLKAAKDGGYQDPQLDAALASAFKLSNDSAGGLTYAQQEIAAAKAKGSKPSELSIRTALQAAYDSKQAGAATDLSAMLVETYPQPDSVGIASQVTRALTSLDAQADLDLARLMARAGALSTRSDYLAYVQDADPRRSPGETLKIINQGVAAGKLSQADVAEMRSMANARVTSDRASLGSYEKEARGPSASFASINGAADAYLSYDQPAKAEELFKLALPKAGGEKDRVLTRLGIAQADQGKYAEAQSTFAQVAGPRAAVAKLWIAYIKSKSAGGAAPTPAAS